MLDNERFETRLDGKEVRLFTLTNENNLSVQICNYGARIVSLYTPDSYGNFDDIVLGHQSIDGYLNSNEKYFGAAIGRYANRIKDARFLLNSQEYLLDANSGINCLHGGSQGFHNVVWDVVSVDSNHIQLHYLSVDGEGGFPGNLKVNLAFQWDSNNQLNLIFKAETDEETHINLTHHSYFNLSGNPASSIEDHLLQINSKFITPIDDHLIPTGGRMCIVGSPFDFLEYTPIGSRIKDVHDQLRFTSGYDHNFVIGNGEEKVPMGSCAAKVMHKQSGRLLELYTDLPGLQFYSGNFLAGQDSGKYGISYKSRSAFCLEPQHFPNSPHEGHFPSTLLKPGQNYRSSIGYKFGLSI